MEAKQSKESVARDLVRRQLGEVVLVGKTPETPQKVEIEPIIPEKASLKPPKTTSKENVNFSKEKIGSEKDQKDENVEKVDKPKVDSVKGSENEKKEKDEAKSDEKSAGKRKRDDLEKKNVEMVNKMVDKVIAEDSASEIRSLEPLAHQVLAKDSKVPSTDFEKVSCYIPAHISKYNFVCNMSKNRFADVICMDHSRVSLADSGYIHASWINVDTKKKAILTQFPLRKTAADFWQMLIEQKVKCVLLIMTEKEYKKFGGDFIFPLNQFIHVHHYKNWLHNSVPAEPKQIWQLQSYLQKYAEPPVYMSLSGCGRAGTYALFETAHASVHGSSPTFNMVKCLENVRNGRLHAVQSLSQFSFVYNLIADHIIGNSQCKEAGGDQENSTVAMLRQLTIQ
ncbi:hypothetical protein CAEBREN_31404 [Caenorhabditis brenneri]|uniref:Tyrosine-protein phosphatase domain-containing protein n=1 Tax=Caenorhabditis brenneri TaxID=135651 RepID=G0P225_CAEBE|nr:hypothetical protein CAEBREN_31404 [Caenorhabditis brenneri]